eukprot:CAMPEP_0201668706 /NCGR_PEP_ID=MMETSP0494-20130426/20689_1 /ASSEMBLY_ACC=CAM_ASM_000839 /TAXON_ID=420259 /ORGANISM="Thalassiosira gravida, Strain GMp14c1" /LENGTH=354 /DNA_ID=CAMNT_0048149209 /DNA_START=73 /DNA_END=1137 /DNA_ORIENTATION=+
MANPRSVAQLVVVLATTAISAIHGFTPPPSISISTIPNDAIQRSQYSRPPSTIIALNQEKEKKGSTDINRTKLLVETVAPFRGLRLFFYAAFASGAFVGGLITLSGVAAAMNGLREDVDMNTEYLNLAIDFGAVAFFGVCAKFDLDKDAELTAVVEAKVEKKKANKKITASMREREQLLKELNVDVKVSQDGGTRVAPLGVMQENAKQHVILVAGPGRAIRDALRGAQLNKVNFAMTNILVVPYETGINVAEKAAKPDGGGFGDSRPSYETQPYVAEPVGEGWEKFVKAEMDTAAEQAGDKVFEEGIALVVANDGKVLRRGVGKVPWRQMVDELEEAVTGEEKEKANPLLDFIE